MALAFFQYMPKENFVRHVAEIGSEINGTFDFESGDLSGWSLKRLPNPEHARIITNPTRAGKYAVAVTLSPGERYKDGWKSELSDKLLAPFNKEIWYRVSHYLPAGFSPQKGNSCILAQWHNAGEVGFSPLLAHRYVNGILHVTVAYGTADIPKSYDDVVSEDFFKVPMAKDIWHNFVYRAYWSRGEAGWIKAWYNGKYMGIYKGPTGYKIDSDGPYFKAGVYCEETPDQALTAYFDEYRRGETARDVLLPDETLENPR